ncbi:MULTISPECIES: OmpP1/FadL family transporter [Sphingomonadales]|jgi:long-chain fatty acid transport protein|uniref:Membrane protein involved in aromatic hydrocarbon degradation n=1 Tax=Rhizorhabdus wittichii (strain DSM 6014 / CCUG 31198 / JCM 15750 / NBRC 105917 / EY 4224 / RW1) TaxID=392499 RepID=A0A9J9HE67_RHIWR|nr:membrane protein involved in aromatic hydrocarbon degradation [Rhizorhabdus wittichii RW1]
MTISNLRRIALAGAASTIALLGAGAADASAFYLQEQSVVAAGRAFSGEAADQGAQSLWWNPAAIAGNEKSTAYLGFSAIMPKGKVRNVGTIIARPGQAPAPVGGNQVSVDPLNKGYLPSGAVGWKINDQWSVGLALTAPYSFATNYENNSWARYTADKTKLTTIDLQPTIAFAPSPLIGIGVGLNIERSKASLSNSLPNLSPLLPDGHQTLRGKGWDFGWSAGVQIHPSEIIDLGFSYKSSVKHKLKGSITTAGLLGPLGGQNGRIEDITASFRTPWQAMASARIHVSDQLTLNGQVVRAGWKKFDAIRLGAPVNAALDQNYKNSWSVAGGVDYAVTPQWTMRGGVQWDQTPTQDGSRDARVPDASRINFALGTSYAITESITLDAAANYVDFKNASIDRLGGFYVGTPAQTIIRPDGRLTGAHAIVLAVGGRMSF